MELFRHRFTVQDYHRMVEAGILAEDERVELLRGDVAEMTPISRRHAACVIRLTRLFSEGLGTRALVSVQNPVRIASHSEPQPDVTLLRLRSDDYESSLPQSEDILLLVEVCDASLKYDRTVKVPLYAAAGIEEVWLIDLKGGGIVVCRKPTLGGYEQVHAASRGECLTPSQLPGFEVRVEDLLV